MSRPRADQDARPTLVSSRVQLAGELADGPAGVVLEVAGGARWVRFDGDQAPHLVELEQLRRLP